MKKRIWIIVAAIIGLFFWKGFKVTLAVTAAAIGGWTIWCVVWDGYRQRRRKVCLPDTPIRDLLRPEPTRVHHVESGTGPHSHSAPRSTFDNGLLRIGRPAKLVEEPCGTAAPKTDTSTTAPPATCKPPPAAVAELSPDEKFVQHVEKEVAAYEQRRPGCQPRERRKVVKRRKAKMSNDSVAITRKPGQPCPQSGQWTCRFNRRTTQRTVVKGEPLPPFPKGVSGTTWKLTDPTRHHSRIVAGAKKIQVKGHKTVPLSKHAYTWNLADKTFRVLKPKHRRP